MTPWDAVLGSRPVGDPAGMRAYAARLRAIAAQIAGTSAGAASGVDRATFVGPAGEAMRMRVSRLRQRGRTAAEQLRDLAADIATRASQVEDAQKAWDARRDRLEREAREARDRAAREARELHRS